MTARLLALSVTVLGSSLLLVGPAAAAPTSTCPTSFQPVTAKDVRAELRRNGVTDKEVLAGVDAGVFSRDTNGDGILCQQIGSYGQAQGLPEYYSNFKDNTITR